ncbi:UNVERIFIED_CONTAM: hypothetical protein K2H54_057941 [Gekko kuhli]
MCVLKSTFKIPLQGPFEWTYPVFQLAFGICIASLEKVSIVKPQKEIFMDGVEGEDSTSVDEGLEFPKCIACIFCFIKTGYFTDNPYNFMCTFPIYAYYISSK